MKISPQLKSDVIKVFNITIAFLLINWFFSFYNDGMIHSEYTLGVSGFYDAKMALLMNSITGLLAGIIGGTALVFVNKRYFRKKSYSYALRATFIAYSIVYVFVTVFGTFLSARIALGNEFGFSGLIEYVSIFVFSQMAIVFYIFWGSVSIFTLIFLQISDKFGPGMFQKFLLGKYHQPKEEQRIFMFMDMKSSTTIAEKMGSKDYFNLLNEIYTDMTDVILSSEGEIYQYVGDEIVISWSLENGVRHANCIQCFYKIKNLLRNLRPYYEEKYGVGPEFKAGLHYGTVTAGEMGSIKKDIAYSGDVLNTTARIQEQCNKYNVDFLISGNTLRLLGDKNMHDPVYLGKIELRGKSQSIDLNSLVFTTSSV